MSSSTLAPTAARLIAAAARVGELVATAEVGALSGDTLVAVLREVSEARAAAELIAAAATAQVARRSTREHGTDGLAQRMGHRNATSLVQNLTGQSRADVARSLRTGEDLDAAEARAGEPAFDDRAAQTPDADGPDADGPGFDPSRWRRLLTDALRAGRVTQAQYQAIRVGLGEPPIERYPDLDPVFLPSAWAHAAELLLDEAATLPVEELRAAARTARDRLDPVGVTLRFEERFAARSLRMWIDEHGQRHAKIAFDDDAAAWVDSILQAALRPRRGPRFVEAGTDAARAAAETAADDRSTEQLQYDTILAVLRAGAAADPGQAFGDRQPGVRMVVDAAVVRSDDGDTRVTGVGHLEDGGHALPGGTVETYLCDAGSVTVQVDAFGRPLDVGREHRLFTRKQRIAIAARDGGCLGEHCTAPISHCEMHHLEHWWEDHGRTDVDDGIALCRNCHLRLHNRRARITRTRDPVSGLDTYWWHDPPDPVSGESPAPRALRTRSPRRFTAA